jgi:hypothetical protein
MRLPLRWLHQTLGFSVAHYMKPLSKSVPVNSGKGRNIQKKPQWLSCISDVLCVQAIETDVNG